MAVSARCWSCCGFIVLALLLRTALLHAAEAEEASSLGQPCPSLDACRAGVPNESCCRAIENAITNAADKCSCACRQLGRYNHGHLVRDCGNGRWCLRCGVCSCAKAGEGIGLLKLAF